MWVLGSRTSGRGVRPIQRAAGFFAGRTWALTALGGPRRHNERRRAVSELVRDDLSVFGDTLPSPNGEECDVTAPCACQPAASPEFPFCPRCGGTAGAEGFDSPQGDAAKLQFRTGDNVSFSGNFAGRDIIANTVSNYREMEMARSKTTKAWLPDNWLATAAAGAGVIGVALNVSLNHQSWSALLTLAIAVPVLAGLVVMAIHARVARAGAVAAFGLVFEEGPDGTLRQSVAVGTCPQCQRRMTVERIKTDAGDQHWWVCASGVSWHHLWFDPTEFHKIGW